MELDPVDVIQHLKALGYENVDPHLLQKFMKGNAINSNTLTIYVYKIRSEKWLKFINNKTVLI